jgi:hypothetical protein
MTKKERKYKETILSEEKGKKILKDTTERVSMGKSDKKRQV